MVDSTAIVTSLLETGGIGVFLFFVYRALRREIVGLRQIIDNQAKTLDVMERRILETEKAGDIYRRLVRELPDDVEKYRQLVSGLKDEMIRELESAKSQKDQELEELTARRLRELEEQERLVGELPQLRADLMQLVDTIQHHLTAVNAPSGDLGPVFDRWLESMEERGLILQKDEKAGCYLSTAAIERRALGDNCAELVGLRWFRDTFVARLPEGSEILREYYSTAPKIVSAIESKENAAQVFESVYTTLVWPMFELLATGKREMAFELYRREVESLKVRYLKVGE